MILPALLFFRSPYRGTWTPCHLLLYSSKELKLWNPLRELEREEHNSQQAQLCDRVRYTGGQPTRKLKTGGNEGETVPHKQSGDHCSTMTFLKNLTNVRILVSYIHHLGGTTSPQAHKCPKHPRCEQNQSEPGLIYSNEGQVSSLPGNQMQLRPSDYVPYNRQTTSVGGPTHKHRHNNRCNDAGVVRAFDGP